MKRYLITGQVGSGKSTIGEQLALRGYAVVDTDFTEGVSGWLHRGTHQAVAESPPYPLPKAWLVEHVWAWQPDRLRQLILDPAHEVLFFCGAAHNRKDFADLFDRTFYLMLDSAALRLRLQRREPLRWTHDSAELRSVLEWNDEHGDFDAHTEIAVDATKTVAEVVEEILAHLQADLAGSAARSSKPAAPERP